MVKEKRNAPRLRVAWPAKLHIKTKGDHWAIVRNISESGVQIDTETMIEEDSVVMLEMMAIHKNKQHMLRSIMSVAYIHAEMKNGQKVFVVGLSFVKLRECDEDFLLTMFADMAEPKDD